MGVKGLPLSGVKDKGDGSSTSHTSSCQSAELVKHCDNFTCFRLLQVCGTRLKVFSSSSFLVLYCKIVTVFCTGFVLYVGSYFRFCVLRSQKMSISTMR
jgi:hypothetical protein